MGYAKLFSSITESSLWGEPKEVRLLFVSMLARADSTGFVEAAIPGLARVSNLSLGETVDAIAILESPDPHSKDLDSHPENEGRRVLKVPGGWMMLNYTEYRDRPDDEKRREYMRGYMKDYRKQRKPLLTSVNPGEPRLTHAETETDAKTETNTPPPAPASGVRAASGRVKPTPSERGLKFADWFRKELPGGHKAQGWMEGKLGAGLRRPHSHR
jgi:hypothetical protein